MSSIGPRTAVNYQPGETLVGVPTIAEVLNVTQKTALSYCLRGVLPTIQADGRFFVRAVDLEEVRADHPAPFFTRGRLELKTAPAAERQRKQLAGSRVEIKADQAGNFVALVYLCTGAPDLDGDLIAPSAFRAGDDVVVSQWGHSAFGDALPAGRGTLRVDGSKILVDGRFFLEATHGLDTYETVKQLGDRCEWSIGYAVKSSRYPTSDEAKFGVERVILALEIFECSPVNKGAAGDGRSGTVAIKSAESIEEIKAHNVLMAAQRERYVAAEIPRRYVETDTRIAAERSRKLSGRILSHDVPCVLPKIRYFGEALAKSLNVAGSVFTSHLDEIWLFEGLSERRAVESCAHELLHACDPTIDERAVKRFGKLIAEIDRLNAELLLGEPDATPITKDELTLLVTKDFRLFKSLQLIADERAPIGSKVWNVYTGRTRWPRDYYGNSLPPEAEILRFAWNEITLLV